MSERDDVTDPLEDGLRRLFHDDRLTISPSPGARAGIVAGARRVRRRREMAMAGGGTMAAVAVVAAGVLLAVRPGDGGDPVAAPYNSSTLQPGGPTKTVPPTSSSGKKTTGKKSPSSVDSGPGTGGDGPKTKTSEPPPPDNYTATLPVPGGGSTIGPNGYGALTLGMSFEEIQPYLTEGAQPPGGCDSYQLAEGGDTVSTVIISPAGLARINASGGRTPEGMGAGDTVEMLQQTYPEGKQLESGERFDAPAADSATYEFPLDGGAATTLSLTNGAC